MKTKPYNLLLHPVFFFALAVLILNDWYLKYQFPNDITGKLSDFSGLFAFAVFFSVLFPDHKKIVTLLTGLIFIWWKSPVSEPLIIFFNTRLDLPVYRVVDYTDYIALIVLPFSIYIKPVYYTPSLFRKIAIGCVCVISFTSFTATSMIRRATDENKISLEKYITTRKTEVDVITAMQNAGMAPEKIPAIYDKAWSTNYYLRVPNRDSSFNMVAVDSLYNGIYTKINYGHAYIIPVVPVAGDTVNNLEFVFSDLTSKKNQVRLHSFQYRKDTISAYISGYPIWKKFKKPLKKKFKSLLR